MVDYYVAIPYNISILRKAVCLWINYIGIPTAALQDWEHERRTPPPYIIGMMERILELEKELSEKGLIFCMFSWKCQ